MTGEKKDWFTNGWCSPYWKAFKNEKKDNEELLIYSARKSGKTKMWFKLINDWVEKYNKEIKKITIEFI